MNRTALAAVLLAAAIPGLLFAPVFGLAALVLPVAVVLVLCFAVAELCHHKPALTAWRAPITLLVGLIGITETELIDTTLAGLPTPATVRALIEGCTTSWLLTLQTTWPARPDPRLLIFVPLAVLLISVLGMELLRWPLPALLPSLVFLGVSQAFVASTGFAALAYVAAAATLLTKTRVRGLLPTAVLSVAALAIALAVIPLRTPPVSLQNTQPAAAPADQLANPLDEVAGWLRQPKQPVFSYTATAPVDRWRLAVLDDFNGVSWTPGPAQYRRMGLTIVPETGVPASRQSAQLTLLGQPDGPWLPSQAMPASVTGVDPLIDQRSGTLVAAQPGASAYSLSWWDPTVTAAALAGAAIDPTEETGAPVGAVPPGISQLADTAVHGTRPSFQTALVLARYLSQHYQLATGSDLPTGSGWPQLRSFLLVTKRGTTVQFAAAYVVLARLLGIPARIAVGFHATAPANNGRVIVHDGDAFAWPEVAVQGVGWVPLDPTGATSSSNGTGTTLTNAVDKALTELPKQQDLRSQPVPTTQPTIAPAPDLGGSSDIAAVIITVLLSLLALTTLAFLCIPVLRAIRYWRRRRLTGAAGVVAAGQEAVDRLRANGVPVRTGMTIRDLAAATPEPVAAGLAELADITDVALWSGFGVTSPEPAWAAVHQIRRGLADRPPSARFRATFNPAGLTRAGEK